MGSRADELKDKHALIVEGDTQARQVLNINGWQIF